MRIDVLTIFPDYLAPLELSLPGKARRRGLLDVRVHDLRDWTSDRHRTVDDTPYGGGAGMVMTPEPWGAALDELTDDGDRPTILFTTPSGERFTQRLAEELATRPRLIFACGRYEGIDARVMEHARSLGEVREVSLGDYVLNGGEVAALAITEAVVRLLPGFMGNPDSLLEESHTDGLLEYPVYTKPSSWRGHQVPQVLLEGNHAAIAAWRHEQALRRTAQRRPDLLHPGAVGAEEEIRPASRADAGELLTLQRACWASPETVEDVIASLEEHLTYLIRAGGRLLGSVRGRLDGEVWHLDRLMVVPDLRGRGIEGRLVTQILGATPPDAVSARLVALAPGAEELRSYKSAGFRVRGTAPEPPGAVLLTRSLRG